MNSTLENISTEELEALLKKKKEAQRKLAEKERKAYEANRDKVVAEAINKALSISEALEVFKQHCHEVMAFQEEALRKYGQLRKNSKGGFSLTNSDGNMRVVRRRDTEPTWDERAQAGVDLIKDFLFDTVKKRDKDLFEILLSFLERNKQGDLEYAKVFSLLSHRTRYSDERWVKGLELLEQSFSNHLKGYGFEFKVTDKDGKWVGIPMNFSAV